MDLKNIQVIELLTQVGREIESQSGIVASQHMNPALPQETVKCKKIQVKGVNNLVCYCEAKTNLNFKRRIPC